MESHNSLRQRQRWEITDAQDGWKAETHREEEEEIGQMDKRQGNVSGVILGKAYDSQVSRVTVK